MYDALLRVLEWIDGASAAGWLLGWVALSIVAGFGFNLYVERGRKRGRRFGLDGEEY